MIVLIRERKNQREKSNQWYKVPGGSDSSCLQVDSCLSKVSTGVFICQRNNGELLDRTGFTSLFHSITGGRFGRKATFTIDTAGHRIREAFARARCLSFAAELFTQGFVIDAITQSHLLMAVGTLRGEQLLRRWWRSRRVRFRSIGTALVRSVSTARFVLQTRVQSGERKETELTGVVLLLALVARRRSSSKSLNVDAAGLRLPIDVSLIDVLLVAVALVVTRGRSGAFLSRVMS